MPELASTQPGPLASILLIAYNQQATVAEAIAGALAQTYTPLEIIVSDDRSTDATWQRMQDAVAGYGGPHRVRLNRNERNLGIGAHLSRIAAMAQGELLFVAAGDDVSLPQRCEKVVAAWLANDRRPDLIASALVDIDTQGATHGLLVPSALQEWRSLADWAARPPFVVGAGQAWTRRLFERFDPLPEGTVAEDLVMVFRAIGSGGALTLTEPLVRYRRGGLSRRVRQLSVQQVVQRWQKDNRHALVEAEQMLRDAQRMGRLDEVAKPLNAALARERYVAALFAARSGTERLLVSWRAHDVRPSLRLRLAVYTTAPWLLAPFFALKRALARR
jgi:hypothetical protein